MAYVPNHSDLIVRCLIAQPSNYNMEECLRLKGDLIFLKQLNDNHIINLCDVQLQTLCKISLHLAQRISELHPKKVQIQVVEVNEAWI